MDLSRLLTARRSSAPSTISSFSVWPTVWTSAEAHALLSHTGMKAMVSALAVAAMRPDAAPATTHSRASETPICRGGILNPRASAQRSGHASRASRTISAEATGAVHHPA